MLKTSAEVIGVIRGVWPGIQFNWLPDGTYLLPKLAEVEALVVQSRVAAIQFNGELMDCDDYALLLHSFVKRHRISLSESLSAAESYHWAFGEAFGRKLNRIETPHSVNIFLAEEGLYLLEPQTYETWKASAANDDVLIVKM
jgi:hypothetical protein